MKIWWFTNSKRVAQEKAALQALAAAEPWFELERWWFVGGELTVEATISAHGAAYAVRLRYPDQFPQVPAWVEPRDTEAWWSLHQYGPGGALCLEFRPDAWVETTTGADVLRSAHELLARENPLGVEGTRGVVPSAHHVGQVQSYDWSLSPVLIGAGCRDRLASGAQQDVRATCWYGGEQLPSIYVHDASDRASAWRPPEADPKALWLEMPVIVSAREAPTAPPDKAGVITAGEFTPESSAQLVAAPAAVVLFLGGPEPAAYVLIGGDAPLQRKVFALPDEGGARSGRTATGQGVRVAIVGLGSVGSKMAEILIRSGIRRLTLVDGDIMLPANLERHALDWRDVGQRKVRGVRRRLLNIAPGADVHVVEQNLNWQHSASTHATHVEAIAECDLIVDATADPATTLLLGAVAAGNGRPFVSVEVFEGGIGALIASCVPGLDPPYVTARAAFLAWTEQLDVAPPLPGPRAYEALAGDGAPMIADDAAVTMAASHAARVVLDVADGRAAARESAWLLVGFRAGWVFKHHGHAIALRVGESAAPVADARDEAAEAFVMALWKEVRGASQNRE